MGHPAYRHFPSLFVISDGNLRWHFQNSDCVSAYGMEWRYDVLEFIVVLPIAILVVLVWINHGIYKVTVNQVVLVTLIDSIRGELDTAQDEARRRVPHL